MRKVIIALILSVSFVMVGISATTFSSGQLTGSAWAEGGE